jgi:tRNA-uridine 2-sulfurtransferase
MTKKPRVALGLSGGVDSSTCAHLLVEQGYDVTGVYLECWRAPGCRTEEDRKDALKIALSLDLPFQVLDFKQAYHDKVVEYFFREYKAGRTPNPDIICNKEIKFGLFYDWAVGEGFDFVATGHYANITHINLSSTINQTTQDQTEKQDQSESQTLTKAQTSVPVLLTPQDTHKDQTYFLHLLKQKQLHKIIFPLAKLTKPEVRQAAEDRKIHTASKKDSVGICFIGDIDTQKFLKERLGENPGEVVDAADTIIGQHRGLWFYTIGQRHGFEIQPQSLVEQADGTTINKHNIPPFYVIGKKPETNQLVVGFGGQTLKDKFLINEMHWINPSYQELLQSTNLKIDQEKYPAYVRIRHPGQLLACAIEPQADSYQIQLDQPTQGIAEGQSAVIYIPLTSVTPATEKSPNTAYICLGGGIITT